MKTHAHENEAELIAAGIGRIPREPGSYTITVARESGPPNSNAPARGESWVARDTDGNWRNFCDLHYAETAAEAVTMMYHVHVVGAVEDRGDTASAEILN